jgi:SH3-like domain-containing protein
MIRRFAFPALVLIMLAAVAVSLDAEKIPATAGSDAAASTDESRMLGPSGLQIPRFVSLKTDRVNVRRGPSTTHQVVWVYARKGLPVEIIAEFEHWRRIRDSDGEEGWVYYSLLAGRRTALVAPWLKGERLTLLDAASPNGSPVAAVEAGVLGDIDACNGAWCRFSTNGYTGWVKQELLWGVYPGEQFG